MVLLRAVIFVILFFFNATATTEIYTLSLHDALPIYLVDDVPGGIVLTRQLPQDLVFFGDNHTVEHKGASQHAAAFHHVLLRIDRKSTRLNSSHMSISYAVFCLKKKKLDN